MSNYHPLDQLTPAEITLACQTARQHVAEQTDIKAFKFISTSLREPAKLQVLQYLGIPTSPDEDAKPQGTGRLERAVDISLIDEVTGRAFDAVVTLEGSSGKVTQWTPLAEGVQPSLTAEELSVAEEMCRKSPLVVELCKQVGVSREQIFCDGWSIGVDPRFPHSQRIQQCILYARLDKDENLYAHPMDIWPVFDSNTGELLTIDFSPERDANGKLSTGSTIPPDLTTPEDSHVQKLANRKRIPPPLERFDFLADLIAAKDSSFKIRDDLKPLNITQPEGVSFQMRGNRISWQKWDLHVSFHHREGLVLSTVTYNDDGKIRPILYRMSLAESEWLEQLRKFSWADDPIKVVVPYGDPAHPHPRKFAFDVGEYVGAPSADDEESAKICAQGLGILANELSLGCDCKGVIHYLPGAFVNHAGRPEVIEKAICIHEEDAGLLWKHSDYRAGGRGQSVRSRKLVISSIFTIANYEYALYWNLYMDGTIEIEVRLTGILNLSVLAQGEEPHGFGTQVAPRVNAHNHQHLFSLRIDPMIDGINNSVIETDAVPVDAPTGSDDNYFGNGFIARKKVLDTTADGARTYDHEAGRQWSLVNESKRHYASGQAVGYKIHCRDYPPLLAKPDSWVAKRAPFATKTMWVTPYQEGQFYPAGKHVPQTRDTPRDSVTEWVKGDKSIRNTDIVTYVTFGVTHLPRPEDFPVMPVEHCRLALKPVGFFAVNPALDVPGTVDKHSEVAFGHEVPVNGNGTTNGHQVNLNGGEACCN